MILNPDQTSIAELRSYARVNIVGTSGSGKSVFGEELARQLDLPYFEMDQLFWKTGWAESTDEEFFEKIRNVVERESWVLDGNYTRTVPTKWPRAQLVIWLDLSFATTVVRVTRRAINRSLSKTEIWPGTGNRETLRKTFLSRQSIIWWCVKYYAANRKKYQRMMKSDDFPDLAFLRLLSTEQIARALGQR